jgi:hypothetical protein
MKKKNWLIGISIIAISIFAYRTHTQREIERELARISNAKYAAEKAALEAYYKVSFDPRSCNNKNEQGNVFIAIGEQVFRVKWDESNKYLFIGRTSQYEGDPVRAPINKNKNLIPIDINKPEGCYENPIRAARFKFLIDDDLNKEFSLISSQYYAGNKYYQYIWDQISKNGTAQCVEDNIFSYCKQFSSPPKLP